MATGWITIALICACNIIHCSSDTVEVCNGEIFKPICGDEEVIIVDKALYGRMGLGKCISSQQDHMGCANQVLPLVDKWCSGRRECEAIMPHPDLDTANKRCLEYLRLYLNVSYRCVKTISFDNQCNNVSLVTLSEKQGFIPSMLPAQTGCMTPKSPGIIQATSGQKIKFVLLDFTSLETRTSRTHVYGHIIDRSGGTNKTIYSGEARETDIYTSESHVVEISLSVPEGATEDGVFLLQYTVIGCADPLISQYSWFRRDSEKATVGCEWSDETWELRCIGDKWSGSIGNCSKIVISASTKIYSFLLSPVFLTTSLTSLVVLIVVVSVVSCICCNRKRRKGAGDGPIFPNILEEADSSEDSPKAPRTPRTPRTPRMAKAPAPVVECAEDELLYNVHMRQPIMFNKAGMTNIWEKPLPELPRGMSSDAILEHEAPEQIQGILDLCIDEQAERVFIAPKNENMVRAKTASTNTLPFDRPPSIPDHPSLLPIDYEIVQVRSSVDLSDPIGENTVTDPDTELLLPTRKRADSSSSSSSSTASSTGSPRSSNSTQETPCTASKGSEEDDDDDDSEIPPELPARPAPSPDPDVDLGIDLPDDDHEAVRTSPGQRRPPPPVPTTCCADGECHYNNCECP